MLNGITTIRKGARIYRRVLLTDTFRHTMTFVSVSEAKRFCQLQPKGSAVRWEWVIKKLANAQLPRLYD